MTVVQGGTPSDDQPTFTLVWASYNTTKVASTSRFPEHVTKMCMHTVQTLGSKHPVMIVSAMPEPNLLIVIFCSLLYCDENEDQ